MQDESSQVCSLIQGYLVDRRLDVHLPWLMSARAVLDSEKDFCSLKVQTVLYLRLESYL